MIQHKSSTWFQSPILWSGAIFLCAFWYWGYDGITFSDDVYYITTGHAFWQGNDVLSDYHFSSRFGSYIFSGLMTFLFGFSDRAGSLASLFAYLVTLFLIVKIVPKKRQQFWAVIFFVTQVYLLHFLTKVYPDSLLVFWAILIPFVASYRHVHPITSSFLLVIALLMGFMTKETIVFLFPFPLFILFLDWKSKLLGKFHLYFGVLSICFSILYLGYYWWEFGDPFFRIQSVHQGHYISEYTFFDKDLSSMLWRISFSPLLTFIERGYWLWIILSIPAIFTGLKKYENIKTEFAIAICCMLAGFWWMTTSLEYYNPLYLNPRHLIILVPLLAVLIGLGASSWLDDPKTRNITVAMILVGSFLGMAIGDWKQAVFLSVFASVLWSRDIWKGTFQQAILVILLVVPAIYSARYQHQLKGYDHFKNSLEDALRSEEEVIVVNNFVEFSKEVLLPFQPEHQASLFPIERLNEFEELAPEKFTLIIYSYYKHAYPKEIPDVVDFLDLVEEMGYEVIEEKEDRWVKVFRFLEGGK
ncbi:hypothetical protein Belba_3174 [Belliella baltica DSM 15883]|uniref:Uncharacterized protein n=1 Tax=Belliella baltica (strain DSM 15883 / CIP 108006 / LMG 21964 / BA134) TaxID=866536 RepID=I3Z8W8_BELBD|nr:glycosyltransferase family 39 protein [Belliella baltica]AFL85686.1 hypothetical protein Belba_3174 [Belliella baltica DSM 15883]